MSRSILRMKSESSTIMTDMAIWNLPAKFLGPSQPLFQRENQALLAEEAEIALLGLEHGFGQRVLARRLRADRVTREDGEHRVDQQCEVGRARVEHEHLALLGRPAAPQVAGHV